MTKPDGTVQVEEANDVVSPSWGTWEELLLAFAVNRYGTGAWDSIAAELQKRTSHPALSTPQNCKSKYLDLKRRFFTKNDDDPVADADDDKSNDDESVPLLEELKKLRVAELRREVQRYDLNIESLELKMKKMEEERERSSRREKSVSDLEKKYEEKSSDEPEAKPRDGGEPVTGEESEKDQMSVNESNSTDLGAEKLRTGEKSTSPARTGGDENREPAELKTEPDGKSDSCNGSSNSIEKVDREAKAVSESSQLVGSEAESKEVLMKEYSDTQSSASRSKKEEEEEKDQVRRRSTSGDDEEDQSGAVKELSAEFQSLVDFLQAIRSHKPGSMFERRLRSQETLRYQKLIRQHVDLRTIETRLKEGWYSGSANGFFRDLLLLVNNALAFFTKNSSETNAAVDLRSLISKEMLSQKSAKSDSSSGKQISLQSLSNPNKEEPEPSNSLLLKPRIPGSLIVCRKRSSIAAKASGSSSGADRKKEQTAALLADEKNTKLQPSDNADDEPKITKKRTRDRFPSVSANAKKNGKKQADNNDSKNSVAEQGKNHGKGVSSSQNAESKPENKKNQSTVDSKKRGAANFLNRMKQGSSSNNGVLLAALKNTPLTSESGSGKGGGSEQKKNDSTKRVEKKEHVTRRSTETRQAKEKGSPSKRNVGRPPKRGAAPAPAPPPAPAKRGRERGEVESSGSKQPKKRSRKL